MNHQRVGRENVHSRTRYCRHHGKFDIIANIDYGVPMGNDKSGKRAEAPDYSSASAQCHSKYFPEGVCKMYTTIFEHLGTELS
jgi:hypothetical protein